MVDKIAVHQGHSLKFHPYGTIHEFGIPSGEFAYTFQVHTRMFLFHQPQHAQDRLFDHRHVDQHVTLANAAIHSLKHFSKAVGSGARKTHHKGVIGA